MVSQDTIPFSFSTCGVGIGTGAQINDDRRSGISFLCGYIRKSIRAIAQSSLSLLDPVIYEREVYILGGAMRHEDGVSVTKAENMKQTNEATSDVF